ncbi:MAG: DUF1573 domain-containing protein [Saprospiraceae bacterium]|jgi:hypothetical protein|nr:DUF1573 domain-containing protein [Saprospiraceae bacterium]MBL0295294.1 DUF1573 domain-containing protein [Saprospiraceae bacterium]
MKKILSLLTFCALFATTIMAQSKGPVMSFKETTVDYGEIEQGSEPLRKFKFTNTGDAPLIISNATGSCGCTVPEWPKEPIAPGKSSTIDVRYDTNRPGAFTKTVTLTSNEEGKTKVLTIKGMVKTKPQPESAPAIQNSPLGAPQKSNVKG